MMPLPSPKSNEARGTFVSRCMANPTALADFPDDEQRAAVCFRQWRERQKDHAMTDFRDTVMLDGLRRTADGYLTADAKVARTGIQEYRGFEVGKPEKATVRVYRPEAEVFARDAMHSYAHRPVTLDHPSEFVTADNWKEHAIGQTGDEVVRDGEAVRVPLVLMDSAAIAAIEGGKRELSMGYSATLDWADGETPDGEPYDAIQRNLRMNHLAVVSRARGGSELKLGDNNRGGRKMTDKTRTIMVDGLSVELSDSAAQIVEKALTGYEKRVTDAEKALSDAKAEHQTALDAKDKEIATKDGEIAELKPKVLDATALDARVEARADLVARAKALAPEVETKGVADADIRKAVVAAKRGEDAIKDKSAAYIDAAFDLLAEDAGDDGGPVRDAIRGGLKSQSGDPWNDSIFKKAGVPMKQKEH